MYRRGPVQHMPSLGDAYNEAADAWNRRRLYLGATLLFVGAVVAAPGLVRVTAGVLEAVGVAEGTALVLGIAVAGLAVPVVGGGLLRWVPTTSRLRATGAAGVVLAALAVAAFVAAVPPSGVTGVGSVPVLVAVTYVVGAMLALWSPIVAAGLAAGDNRHDRPRPASSFVRERRSIQPGGRVPADGGEEEQEIAFLLDRDDK